MWETDAHAARELIRSALRSLSRPRPDAHEIRSATEEVRLALRVADDDLRDGLGTAHGDLINGDVEIARHVLEQLIATDGETVLLSPGGLRYHKIDASGRGSVCGRARDSWERRARREVDRRPCDSCYPDDTLHGRSPATQSTAVADASAGGDD